MSNACKSVVDILSATVETRAKKAGGNFHLLKCVCAVNCDDGEIIAGNVEFPVPDTMSAPAPGKYNIRYEPRRDWQDGKIKPQAVEFIPVGKSAPSASASSRPAA